MFYSIHLFPMIYRMIVAQIVLWIEFFLAKKDNPENY